MRKNQYILPLIFIAFWAFTCSPKFESKFASMEDVQVLNSKDQVIQRRTTCDTNEYYAPDPAHFNHRPWYYVRVNFHFLNSSDGKNNIPPSEQYPYIENLVWILNKSLEDNMKMWLPPGNDAPALPIPFRYILTGDRDIPGDKGVYNHVDDELYFFVKKGRYRNNTDMRVIKKYAVNADSVLNIFMMPHHPDSVTSKTYRADASGIALGSALKVSGQWTKKPDAWGARGIFHHEIGHVLGLSHTWNTNDGCNDTPRHPNCFNKSDQPPCDTMYSNNVMDYNAHQAAWSPCQLGKITRNFCRLNSRQRKLLNHNWCTRRDDKLITITERIDWYSARDLQGDLVIADGGVLTIHCRTSIPGKGKIVIAPGGTLNLKSARLHNSCGDQWKGIEIQSLGKKAGNLVFLEPSEIEDTILPFGSIEDQR